MMLKKHTIHLAIALLLIQGVATAGSRLPWPRRTNPHAETFHITAHKNTPISIWPEEPHAPPTLVRQQFETAFRKLCGTVSEQRADRYTAWIIEYADAFEIDPFLLAALVYDQSQCKPVAMKRYRARGLHGLTHLPVAMHERQARKTTYTYWTRGDDSLTKQTLDLVYPINQWKAAKPQSNLYLSAAILHIFAHQEPLLRSAFNHQPYRHYVSHWFYGDRVKSPEPENRVLTARRRLLDYYHHRPVAQAGQFDTVKFVSPLDGTPRLVLDYFGNKRGHKDGYGHRGIDIDGAIGEPVRAIADGRISFSGMDLPGGLNNRRLTVAEAGEMEPSQLPQGGGFYVTINHDNSVGSVYMHLHSFCVEYNQRVKAGEIIGTLGMSGTERSGPHLHLEVRKGEHRADPAIPLAPVLADPFR